MKQFIVFCCNRDVLIGIGIGMIAATIILSGTNFGRASTMSRTQIEEKARNLGMDYPSEFTVIDKKGEGK